MKKSKYKTAKFKQVENVLNYNFIFKETLEEVDSKSLIINLWKINQNHFRVFELWSY